MNRTFALSLMLILGCVAGAATSRMVVPSVHAGTNPTRWEYSCDDDLDRASGGFDAAINALGAEGWEMVGVARSGSMAHDWAVCFKRPLP